MEFSNKLEQMAKKYAKRLLTRLETYGIVNNEVRKAVLDELNSMAREIATMQEKKDGIR
jgi:hypothetical protein